MLPLRLVIDTNVVISAAIRPAGLQRTVLTLALTKPARLYVCLKTASTRAIILHGEPPPTDSDHRTHAHQIPRADEADAGEPSAGRSLAGQEGLRLLPETPRRPESSLRRALSGSSPGSRACPVRDEDGPGRSSRGPAP